MARRQVSSLVGRKGEDSEGWRALGREDEDEVAVGCDLGMGISVDPCFR